jgi:hypothetical protein
MSQIKRFSKFLKESSSTEKEYGLDPRFPWTEEIGSIIDQIIEKVEYIKSEYEWGRHDRHSPVGFEFDIKTRSWPDTEEIAQSSGFTEEEIESMWDLFLADRLEMSGNDFVETYDFFDDWGQTGRSGGWLLMIPDRHTKYLIEDYEEKIRDGVSELNDETESLELEEGELEKWLEIKNMKGFKLLKRLGHEEEYKELDALEKESVSTITYLKNFLNELEGLEKVLSEIQKSIDNFWEKSDEYFIDFVEQEKEYRGLD